KLEVERGNTKAGAQIGELANSCQPPPGDVGQCVFGWYEQIRIVSPVRTPDSSAQLIELCQTVHVRAVDYDRVRQRNVYPVLDDRRAHQHIDLVTNKFQDDFFKLFLTHLPVPNADASLWNEPGDQFGYRVDRFDAVVHEEDLSASLKFELDRRPNYRVGKLDHV